MSEPQLPEPVERAPGITRLHAISAGVVSAGSALGLGEILSGLSRKIPSLVVAVADVVVDNTPGAIARWSIRQLGSNQKPALVWGIIVVSILLGALLGWASQKRRWVAPAGLLVFGVIGGWAAAHNPLSSDGLGWMSGLLSGAFGIVVFLGLYALALSSRPVDEPEEAEARPVPMVGRGRFDDRRRFVGAVGIMAGASLAGGLLGRWLRRRDTVEGARQGFAAQALQGRTIATPTPRPTPTALLVPTDQQASLGPAPNSLGPPTSSTVEATPAATNDPTADPTAQATATPTVDPTAQATATPTVDPTAQATAEVTVDPTAQATATPTADPTAQPVATPDPTAQATATPTADPTAQPTPSATPDPTARATPDPTAQPTPQATPSVTAEPASSANFNHVNGIAPRITPNKDFYLIDTAISDPQVDPNDWSLRIHGMVDREVELGYEELLDLGLVQHEVTLACVSNRVGGGLVGNAVWVGVPLSTVLNQAGPRPGATQIVGRSVDRWTAGFPTEVAFDGRPALVAVQMNGEPLPISHGFPARLVVAGIYGYVSATKWLSEIELTTWDGFDAYWIPRGWSKKGPIKTQSRIDVPRKDSTINPGPTAVAGVAWAPTRAIEGVEVQLNDDPWVPAQLSRETTVNSWRQWMVTWNAIPGTHRIRVRATDGTGYTQTSEVSPPAPDGATGWHTIQVKVNQA
ncbi:molybdopterin-dependent oxidoreductase [Candidatus Poriferisocius sp.]|uniref:molybdopterin-dependent oxidoreductase n=1 Tax=Candidatus Poriferisocius sp. TaxID=3101276 RepID=UPI003B01D01C